MLDQISGAFCDGFWEKAVGLGPVLYAGESYETMSSNSFECSAPSGAIHTRIQQGAGVGLQHPRAARVVAILRSTIGVSDRAGVKRCGDGQDHRATGICGHGPVLQAAPGVPRPAGGENRPSLPEFQGLSHHRPVGLGDPSGEGERDPHEGLSVVGEVHARHQGSDGQELHRQPEGGSPEGPPYQGRARPVPFLCAARLSECSWPRWKADHRAGPDLRPDDHQIVHLVRSCADSFKTLAPKAYAEGFRFRLTRNRIPVTTLHKTLRKRIYTGEFDYAGSTYQGNYEPLVTREAWERVQEILDGRQEKKHRKVTHDFAFSGLVNCGHCGCSLVGEIKKKRYVYYHCTGYRGKCPEPYTREEVLERQFSDGLRDLIVPVPVLDWLQAELITSDVNEQAAREQILRRDQAELERLQKRLDVLYDDRLDERIDASTYDKKAAEIRQQQEGVRRRVLRRRPLRCRPPAKPWT